MKINTSTILNVEAMAKHFAHPEDKNSFLMFVRIFENVNAELLQEIFSEKRSRERAIKFFSRYLANIRLAEFEKYQKRKRALEARELAFDEYMCQIVLSLMFNDLVKSSVPITHGEKMAYSCKEEREKREKREKQLLPTQ